ncbi:hypothetical protein D2N39_22000 [Gemmobacter lutimaris]|uniref:Uncharacterized protein n=1 Tax=Gemmobacter lutimaris TaxID=2306023 RepID=A0A398BJH0_9RHOB|nr:hypothetical protein D2N39_22000 [Gemmobacter lutimaris]
MALFTAFLGTLPRLLEDERDLCGYSGQDPAVDLWIRAADASLAATKAACAAVLAATAVGEANRSVQRVAQLFMDVIESADPEEVADLRANARLRRWAYRVPGEIAGAHQVNLQVDMALDGLESWLALEDPFDARAQAWAEPGLDCDAGPALSA